MPGPMGGMRRGQGNTEKPKDFKKTTKKLIKNYLAKYKIAITQEGESVFKVILGVINKFKKTHLKDITQNELTLLANISKKIV